MVDRAKQILDDIVTLEVNTIINRNISAQKMPKPRFAMCKIGEAYSRYLAGLGADTSAALPEIYSHYSTFTTLAELAKQTANSLQPGESEEEQIEFDLRQVILTRIKNNSEEIINLVRQVAPNDVFFDKSKEKRELTCRKNIYLLNPIPFEAEQLIRLRKINEIGTETIAMQTCVQLDGDVVTRVHPKYALTNSITEEIQKIHSEGLQISIQRWQDIVATIATFFKTLLSLK